MQVMARPIVRRMLAMARVGPGDIVYDLGSGDGRMIGVHNDVLVIFDNDAEGCGAWARRRQLDLPEARHATGRALLCDRPLAA